ncbi:MAG: VCBS repeat-containing protein, partial [Sandaracinaceae bacterium]|nr:VCBS repeat-containing protein [Sandaracinaceae bacterium]
MRSTRRLSAIETRGPEGETDVLRRYVLTHDVGGQTGAMRLREIRECDRLSVCRAPLQFRYEDPAMRGPDQDLENTLIAAHPGWVGQALTPIRGISSAGSDFVFLTRLHLNEGEWRVARHYFEGARWYDEDGWPAGEPSTPGIDFNRVLEPFGQLSDGEHRFLELSAYSDFAGNLLPSTVNISTLSIRAVGDVGATTGSGISPLDPHAYSLTRTPLFTCIEETRMTRILQADLDGDGSIDPIIGGRCWNGEPGAGESTFDHDWVWYRANGSHLTRDLRQLSTTWHVDEVSPTALEMDGDGRQELLGPDGTLVGVGSDGSPELPRTVNLGEGQHVFLDMNGDGLTDVVDVHLGRARLNLGGSWGPSFPVWSDSERIDQAIEPAVQPWDTMVADFNLDGRDDLAVHVAQAVRHEPSYAVLRVPELR